MLRNKAYKFRLCPSAEQCTLLAKTFGCVRMVYNHFLAMRKDLWQDEHRSLSYGEMSKMLPALKTEHPFLKEVDSIALQQSLRHLDTAFQNFFRDTRVGYPKFKSRKRHRDSYTTMCVNGNIRLENGYLVLPKLKKIRIRQHRVIPEHCRLTSVTVSRTPTGKYYASLLVEYETEISAVPIQQSVGLDYSMPDLFVSSDESLKVDPEFLHFHRKAEKQLKREQRKLSHCKKGSRRYQKQRIRLAKRYETVKNRRLDYLHKLSREIADHYDLVAVESLNLQEMSQTFSFGKSIGDNGWSLFVSLLKYKLEDEGKRLVKISSWYPSSKRCHVCGFQKEELTLAEREWTCPGCKTHHDRDQNASINIREEGLRLALT